MQKTRVYTTKKYIETKVCFNYSEEKKVQKLKNIIPKHAQSLTRIMKNNSLVRGKQPAETPTCEVVE